MNSPRALTESSIASCAQAFAAEPVEHKFYASRIGSGGSAGEQVLDEANAALRSMRTWPGYAPTPLWHLAPLAGLLSLRSILYKDEAQRFGLQSFKIMGAGYALALEVDREFGFDSHTCFERTVAAVRTRGAPFTVTCATDGNHGRAVAWAAMQLGLPCVVFLHERVSAARGAAIASLRATIQRVKGNYDDSVRAADAQARLCGWRVISDTAYADYERVPRDIVRGYMGLCAEIGQEMGAAEAPTHIFAQAGVGGLASAMFGYFAARYPASLLTNICIEPQAAACLLESARAGRRSITRGSLDSIMAGLACGEPSTLAWDAISARDTHFIAITDDAAAKAMRLLADPGIVGTRITAGESGAAGLAGLLCVCADPLLRDAMQLDERSNVLLIGTEGATDCESYHRIVHEHASAARVKACSMDMAISRGGSA